MKVETDRIWTIGENDVVIPRSGDVLLCEDEMIVDLRDIKRALTITDGLTPRDVAVFLRISGHPEPDQPPVDEVVGFVVSKIATPYDGSGLLTHGDTIDSDPRGWGNDHIFDTWEYVEQISPGACADFTLQGLYSHIQQIRR